MSKEVARTLAEVLTTPNAADESPTNVADALLSIAGGLHDAAAAIRGESFAAYDNEEFVMAQVVA